MRPPALKWKNLPTAFFKMYFIVDFILLCHAYLFFSRLHGTVEGLEAGCFKSEVGRSVCGNGVVDDSAEATAACIGPLKCLFTVHVGCANRLDY